MSVNSLRIQLKGGESPDRREADRFMLTEMLARQFYSIRGVVCSLSRADYDNVHALILALTFDPPLNVEIAREIRQFLDHNASVDLDVTFSEAAYLANNLEITLHNELGAQQSRVKVSSYSSKIGESITDQGNTRIGSGRISGIEPIDPWPLPKKSNP